MTKRIKLRTLLVGGVITLLFAVLFSKIYWVQVVEADFWSDKARKVWSSSQTLKPVRGTITDRDGNVLAMDSAAYIVAVNPEIIHKLGTEDFVVSKLHLILGKKESELRDIITAKKEDGNYYTQREVRPEGFKIDKATKDRVVGLTEELKKMKPKANDVGIYLLPETKRYYPKDSMAAHVLGYINKDGKAVGGIESYLNKELGGTEGKIKYERDGNGIILEDGTVEFVPSKDGSNVKLTIDADIQHYVEEAIQEVYDKYQPHSISAIAADPQTMEILGMANLPTYNPNEYWKSSQAGFFNHIVQSQYEPGSTFKIVTLSGAVQEGYFNPNDSYMSGSIKVGGKIINDIKRGGWGEITYLEGLKKSSNVAFVKLGYEMLKTDKLLQYIQDFGFGVKTGIELPGEIKGDVDIDRNIPRDVATVTFGQNVAVSPIQQVAAIAAAANGGRLLEPHIVKEIEDPTTNKTVVKQPKMIRQVISKEASKKVSEYLEQVVSDGTGKNAYIPGYRVAGKTGTAQKVVNGVYSKDEFVVSFIGYAPADNPKIIVYVVVDSPNDKDLGGGAVAAPVFKNIVQNSLRHMGIAPQLPETDEGGDAKQKDPMISVPDLNGSSPEQAKTKLQAKALKAEIVGKGTTIKQQIPASGTKIALNQTVYLLTEERSELAVPNMRGSSLREALEICSLLGIQAVAVGEGFVTDQTLAKLNGERVVKLTLAPPNPDESANDAQTEEGSEDATEDAPDANAPSGD
ncbi:penicillin-binding transpeptidase domain-containing protein [Paenibacillus aurantiacus]|uniref:Penicillin-binding transpeptidase domain-containing protein n=1 Tax=Paenibacillus aurantiacus TaxID=1936118 RepID=A0ABV5KMH1_9BACL